MSKLKIAIISILGLAVTIGATVGILLLVNPKSDTVEPLTQNTQTVKSSEVIAALQQGIASDTIKVPGIASALGEGSIQPMLLKSDSLYVQLTTEHGLTIRSVEQTGFTDADTATVQTEITNFLKEKGYIITESSVQATKLFASAEGSDCSVAVTNAEPTVILSYQLLCIDESTSAAAIKDVTTQLGLWPQKPGELRNYTISSTAVTEGAYTAAISRVTNADNSKTNSLVFVKADGQWNYIGDASTGTPVESNELYVINADIKKGIDNAKYGGVVKKVLTN